jgi:hypothetical protein
MFAGKAMIEAELPLFPDDDSDAEILERRTIEWGENKGATALLTLLNKMTPNTYYLDNDEKYEHGVSHRFASSLKILRHRGYEVALHRVQHQRAADGKKRAPMHWYTLTYSPPIENKKISEDLKQFYYDTDHWRAMRQLRLEFDDYCCVRCKQTEDEAEEPLSVHHWCYSLFDEDLLHIMTLCRLCHTWMHNLNRPNGFPPYADPDIVDRLQREYDEAHQCTK